MKFLVIYSVLLWPFLAFSTAFDDLPYDRSYRLEVDYEKLTYSELQSILELNLEGHMDQQDKKFVTRYRQMLESDFVNVSVDVSHLSRMSDEELVRLIREGREKLKEKIELIQKMETVRREEGVRVRNIFAVRDAEVREKVSEINREIDFQDLIRTETSLWVEVVRTVMQATSSGRQGERSGAGPGARRQGDGPRAGQPGGRAGGRPGGPPRGGN